MDIKLGNNIFVSLGNNNIIAYSLNGINWNTYTNYLLATPLTVVISNVLLIVLPSAR